MTEIHKGPCADCARPMIDQREWSRNSPVRAGHAKAAGLGLCQACSMRWRRHGKLPSVTVGSVTTYTVACDKCGPLGTADSRAEAARLRGEHLETHGLRVKPAALPDAEVKRLRRMIGIAS